MRAVRGLSLSLRHLLILLAAIGLLPLALLGSWSIHRAAEHRLEEQQRNLLELARALSSAVDAELDGTVARLSGLTHGPELQAGDLRAFYAGATRLVESQPDWLGVVLTDGDGRLLLRTMAPFGAQGGIIVDRDSVDQASALHRPVVGRIMRGAGGRPAVPVRLPFVDGHGRAYILSAVVQPTRFLDVIARQRVPVDSVISILDASGTTVGRSINHERAVARPPGPGLAALMRTGGLENAGPSTTREGRPIVTAYTRASRYGWTVAAGEPPASSPTGFLLIAAGLAGSIGVCVALASWLARRIVRRIDDLARDAAALGAGEPVRAAVSHIREIDGMATALAAAARHRDDHEAERSRLLASLEDAVRSQDRALAQARDAGRAKDEFLAVLGHELRNPLSPIVGSLDLMDMRDEPTSRRERGIMRRQVNHLKRLVDDLLDVSRITSGKLQLDLQPLDLAALLHHTAAALQDGAPHVDAPEPVWVLGDDSRLAQVLGNLLSNAARFGSADTRLALRRDAGTATLTVSDDGAGIGADHLPHVFEPFFQAPQPLARRTGGLGLGLAIVRKIIDLHGGRIAAFSDGPGRGSRFEIVLPLAAAPAAAPPVAAPAAVAPQRILVVDDNEDAAGLAASLLAQMGHTVRVAHNGRDALAAAAEFAPQAAICDIGLPDMDGYALAGALRARVGADVRAHADAGAGERSDAGAGAREGAAAPALRLIALTGYGQQTDVRRATEAGFDVHLTKPATADELQRALDPTAAPAR